MRYSGLQIVFQEIPNEISLAIHVVGCPLRCPGCHSSDLWNVHKGVMLTEDHFIYLLTQYGKYISCVLFMGGEWELKSLVHLINLSQKNHLKTALYTGLEWHQIIPELKAQLDYLKYGPWVQHLGGLSSPETNQRLINLKTMEVLNSYFTEGNHHGALNTRAN